MAKANDMLNGFGNRNTEIRQYEIDYKIAYNLDDARKSFKQQDYNSMLESVNNVEFYVKRYKKYVKSLGGKKKRNNGNLYQHIKAKLIAKKNKARQDADFHWFVKHYMELYNQYGEKYLIIKNKHVLDTAETYKEGIDKGRKTEELGTFIVQHCNGKEEAYTSQIMSCK